MPRTFEIAEPTRNLRALLLLFTLIPISIILAVVYAFIRPAPPLPVPIATLVVIIVLNLVIPRLMDRRQVALDGNTLEILAGMTTQSIATSAIDLVHARALRLDEHPEWRPYLKAGGLGMPGLSLGWFIARNQIRLFCLLTDHHRVVLLPLRDRKEAILLSLKRPDELLSALRGADDARQQRR